MKTHIFSVASPEVAVIGGGNGASALLEGFASQDLRVSAVVNSTDNGGSTGRLREAYPGLIGVGDIRQCMGALANNTRLAKQFNARGSDGHAAGNLLLVRSALEAGGVSCIEAAIEEWADRLDLRGQVVPVTLDNAQLRLDFPYNTDQTPIEGEFQVINTPTHHIRSKLGQLSLSPAASLNPRAEDTLLRADAIVIAPGNFYGSIVPPLLTDGMRETIEASGSPVVLVSNITNNEKTAGFSVADYVDELRRHTGIVPDMVVANDSTDELYTDEEVVRAVSHRSTRMITANLISQLHADYDPHDVIAATRSRLRHNGQMIGAILRGQLQAA